MQETAKKHGMVIVVPIYEREQVGVYYNTAAVIDADGLYLGKYRKTHAAVDHYEGQPPWARPPKSKDTQWFIRNDPEWIMEKGDDLPVFDLDFGKGVTLSGRATLAGRPFGDATVSASGVDVS